MYQRLLKSMLSVSKFLKITVLFKFHPNSCFIKSQDSKKILLERHVKNELYAFENLKIALSSNNSCNYVEALCTSRCNNKCWLVFVEARVMTYERKARLESET